MFRTKKVAVVFDFDKTLSPYYMQRGVFAHFGVDEEAFWQECKRFSDENRVLLGSNHAELSYMNTFLAYVQDGRMPGLSNQLLTSLGAQIELYPGVAPLFAELHRMGVEIYIVSSGIRAMLLGFEQRIKEQIGDSTFKLRMYGGDFREKDGVIHQIASVISPMDKLKAVYEISKGCETYGFDVWTSIPKDSRRIPLEFMIYIGDGPSDTPAFNLIHDSGGFTLGVFNSNSPAQFEQIERIRADGRLDSVAVADYSVGSTAYHWIIYKCRELLYKSSEDYEYRQTLQDLRSKRIGHIHPWNTPGEPNGTHKT